MITNNQRKIPYGKNIYNHKEIEAVSKIANKNNSDR